ncbi:MAG TPA: cohesin domain-containing protein, partial [Candidatus Moranbacteria bacterium]|nr:cohesin domain-containing protein [Candidatus Moranbacteria bacterium]
MKVIGNGKKILIGTLVVIFTVFCCLLVIFPTKAATDAILSFDQSGVSVETGDTVTLIARINPGTNEVGAVELDVTFNPSVLRLDSITPNASAFNLTLDGPTIDNAGTGNTDGNGSIDVGSLTNVYTSTTNVATFVFTALSDATDSPVAFAATSDASAHG